MLHEIERFQTKMNLMLEFRSKRFYFCCCFFLNQSSFSLFYSFYKIYLKNHFFWNRATTIFLVLITHIVFNVFCVFVLQIFFSVSFILRFTHLLVYTIYRQTDNFCKHTQSAKKKIQKERKNKYDQQNGKENETIVTDSTPNNICQCI